MGSNHRDRSILYDLYGSNLEAGKIEREREREKLLYEYVYKSERKNFFWEK
jgi:hypothetical protein